ncbi:hypothetical protein [Methanobrevibacter sp.]|uniref:hypothetical protein n=1 Tax=Methanobrevibacter sp. TaxID=66852 RepID=UPI0025E2CCD5|nr:hypothetical protein [Methanobrevibacter sp.]MBR4448317.1 hypothetical protein [Methanobrevibacter sp.]
MSDDVLENIMKRFDVNQDVTLEFKELCGFTFVFKKKVITFRDYISAEIKPLGIIYDENGEYYFAPLYRSVNLNRVVKEYMENY